MTCHNEVAIFCFEPPPFLVSAGELGVIPPHCLASFYPDCLPVWIHFRDFHVRLTVAFTLQAPLSCFPLHPFGASSTVGCVSVSRVLSLLILMGFRGLRSLPVSLVRFSC